MVIHITRNWQKPLPSIIQVKQKQLLLHLHLHSPFSLLCSVFIDHQLFHMPSFIHTVFLLMLKVIVQLLRFIHLSGSQITPGSFFKNKIVFRCCSGCSYMSFFSCRYLWHSHPTTPRGERSVFPFPQKIRWGLPVTLGQKSLPFFTLNCFFALLDFAELFLQSEVLKFP